MKAVIVATGYSETLKPLIYKRPTALLHIVDKPMIVHVVEALVRHGITDLHIVLGHYPEMVEAVLEEGSRWGVQVTYHLTTDWKRPFRTLTPAAKDWRDPWVVIANANVLPKQHLRELFEPPKSLLWYTPGQRWSGWGIVRREAIANLNRHMQLQAFPGSLSSASHKIIQKPFFSVLSASDLQRSNLHCLRLARPCALFPSATRRVQPGLWISKGVVIHPSAMILPPVFLSEYAQIGEGAQIGPEAIVEAHCVIDKGSSVKKSVICRGSYVGESLEVRNSIVDHNTLINFSHKSHVQVPDEFILGELKTPMHRVHLSSLLIRTMAFIGLISMAPLLVFLIARYGLTRTEVLKLPASGHRQEWTTFSLLHLGRKPRWLPKWFVSLPTTINLIQGQVHLVGLRPVTLVEVEALAPDYRQLYLRSKVGLITLQCVEHGRHASPEERLATDSYYATKRTLNMDLRILWRWIKKAFTNKEKNRQT